MQNESTDVNGAHGVVLSDPLGMHFSTATLQLPFARPWSAGGPRRSGTPTALALTPRSDWFGCRLALSSPEMSSIGSAALADGLEAPQTAPSRRATADFWRANSTPSRFAAPSDATPFRVTAAIGLLRRVLCEALRARYFHRWWRRALRPKTVLSSTPRRNPIPAERSPTAASNEAKERLSRSREMVRAFYCANLEDEEALARAAFDEEETRARCRLQSKVKRAIDEVIMIALRRPLRGAPPKWGAIDSHVTRQSGAPIETGSATETEKNPHEAENRKAEGEGRRKRKETGEEAMEKDESQSCEEQKAEVRVLQRASALGGRSPIATTLMPPPAGRMDGNPLRDSLRVSASVGQRTPTASSLSKVNSLSCSFSLPPSGHCGVERPPRTNDGASTSGGLSPETPRFAAQTRSASTGLDQRVYEKLREVESTRRRRVAERYRVALEHIICLCFGDETEENDTELAHPDSQEL